METGEDSGQAFSFAKVWTAENDALEELEDQAPERMAAPDSWAHALELIAREQAQMKATERTGRGVRRKAAIAAENQVYSGVLPIITKALTSIQQKLDFLDSPVRDKPRGKKRKKSRTTTSDESDAYVNDNLNPSENSGDEQLGDDVAQDLAELGAPMRENLGMLTIKPLKKQIQPPSTSDHISRSTPTDVRPRPAHSQEIAICAMCGNAHQGACGMTERSENLVRYRKILFTDQTDESFEERVRNPRLNCAV